MKRKTIILTSFFSLFLVFFIRTPVTGDATEVIIAHFNDLGGQIWPDRKGCGGLVKLAGAWRRFHSEHPNSILLVSGDLITGSSLSTLTRGEGVFRLANRMGFAAFTPGNHEFDYGVEQYLKFMSIARFPFVAANIKPAKNIKESKLSDAPYIILTESGIKVGVIGVISEATPRMTYRKNTAGVEFTDPTGELRNLVPKVKREAELVVAMTHIGMEEDYKLATNVKGIDIIIGGHSYSPTLHPNRVSNTWIVNAGADGEFLGVIYIRLNPVTKKLIKVRSELLPIDKNAQPDPEMAAAAQAEEAKLPVRLDAVIARAATYLDKDADIAPWLAALMKKYTGADVGLINEGGVRSGIEPGAITLRDVYRIMPFDDKIVIIRLPGVELAQWMKKENLIADRNFRPVSGRFYNIATSDFVAEYCPSRPPAMRYMPLNIRDLMINDLSSQGRIRK